MPSQEARARVVANQLVAFVPRVHPVLSQSAAESLDPRVPEVVLVERSAGVRKGERERVYKLTVRGRVYIFTARWRTWRLSAVPGACESVAPRCGVLWER